MLSRRRGPTTPGAPVVAAPADRRRRGRGGPTLILVGRALLATAALAACTSGEDTDPLPTGTIVAQEARVTPSEAQVPAGQPLTGGTTFTLGTDTEVIAGDVVVRAVAGSDRPDRTIASFTVAGPGFEEISVWGPPGVVVEVPEWGRLTVESVQQGSDPGNGSEPPAVLHFRAVTDEPLEVGKPH